MKLVGAVKVLNFKLSQQHIYIRRLREELNSKKRKRETETAICRPIRPKCEKKFSCRWCKQQGKDIQYGYLKNLKRHLLEHHKCNEPGNEKYRYDANGIPIVLPGETIYKYECLCCPKKFEEKRKLVKHMGLQHPHVEASAYKTQRKTPATNFKLCEVKGNKYITLVLN